MFPETAPGRRDARWYKIIIRHQWIVIICKPQNVRESRCTNEAMYLLRYLTNCEYISLEDISPQRRSHERDPRPHACVLQIHDFQVYYVVRIRNNNMIHDYILYNIRIAILINNNYNNNKITAPAWNVIRSLV